MMLNIMINGRKKGQNILMLILIIEIKHSRIFLVFLLTFLSFISSVHALLFERRMTPETEISWFVYPIVGSIPGVQDFYGLGATVSSIGGTDSDITAVSLRGKAEYFDKDFKIDILSVFDIPLFTDHLTLTWFSTKILSISCVTSIALGSR